MVWGLTGAVVVTFAIVTKSFGRLILAFLIIIMMPQATTELGTNGWITALMEDPMKAAGYNSAWVLVYTSAIMLVLRFVAGPLIHKFSPVGLLAACSALAGLGILALSKPPTRASAPFLPPRRCSVSASLFSGRRFSD